MSEKLVTIYIPTYNRVSLLERAIESVRKQTYSNLEIIIVDDCSTDGTIDYLNNICKIDHRIRFFTKSSNSGACVSRNIAIDNANGDYITGLDDDDYFLPDRIEKFINFSYLLNQYSFIFSTILEKTNKISSPRLSFLKPKVVNESTLLFSNIVGNQCFTTLEIMKKYGKFNPTLKAWQDLYTWYNILNKTNGKARFVKNLTYIQDVSHPHERITSSNRYDKIVKVYENFKSDVKLNKRDSYILAGQLVSYGIKLPWKYVFYRVFKCYSIYINLKLIFLVYKNKNNIYDYDPDL